MKTLWQEKEKNFDPKVRFHNMSKLFLPYAMEAKKRIFSLAAGNRIGKIAPRIMEIGYGKVLFAADYLGADIEASNSFILFAPDGTCTYNPIRIKRGFTYGAVIDAEFDGMMATNNSMPNGCGFSMYELLSPPDDDKLIKYMEGRQKVLGADSLSQLGKGNHFAGIYRVTCPVSGEDTNRRFAIVHCSGHAAGDKLYEPQDWLAQTDGYHNISTPHGDIQLLEGEAKKQYLRAFEYTNTTNAKNRDITMGEISPDFDWKKLEEITHQGLNSDGSRHLIGTQKHDASIPIAFNPEEGLVTVRSNPSLHPDFIDLWDQDQRAYHLGIYDKLQSVNIVPHGSGYEFRFDIDKFHVILSKNGIKRFGVQFLEENKTHTFNYFKEIREFMTYRRRNSIMKEVYRANLADIIFELPGLKQVYPLKTIPGGAHN